MASTETTMKLALERAGVARPEDRLRQILRDCVLRGDTDAEGLDELREAGVDVFAAMWTPAEIVQRWRMWRAEVQADIETERGAGHSRAAREGHTPCARAGSDETGGGQKSSADDGRNLSAAARTDDDRGRSALAREGLRCHAPVVARSGGAGQSLSAGIGHARPARTPGHAKRSGIEVRQRPAAVAIVTVLDEYRVRGKAIGDFSYQEVCDLEGQSIRDGYLFRQIRKAIRYHPGVDSMKVRDLCTPEDIQRMIQKAAELADAA